MILSLFAALYAKTLIAGLMLIAGCLVLAAAQYLLRLARAGLRWGWGVVNA